MEINLKCKLNILIGIFVIMCFSCNRKDNVKIESQNVKILGTIYYTDPSLKTFKAVDCDNFKEALRYSISYIPITDLTFIKKIKGEIELNKNSKDEEFIDVRYKIEIDKIELCLDERGNYTLNNIYMGKFNYFEELIKYIETNKKNSKLLEPLPE